MSLTTLERHPGLQHPRRRTVTQVVDPDGGQAEALHRVAERRGDGPRPQRATTGVLEQQPVLRPDLRQRERLLPVLQPKPPQHLHGVVIEADDATSGSGRALGENRLAVSPRQRAVHRERVPVEVEVRPAERQHLGPPYPRVRKQPPDRPVAVVPRRSEERAGLLHRSPRRVSGRRRSASRSAASRTSPAAAGSRTHSWR